MVNFDHVKSRPSAFPPAFSSIITTDAAPPNALFLINMSHKASSDVDEKGLFDCVLTGNFKVLGVLKGVTK